MGKMMMVVVDALTANSCRSGDRHPMHLTTYQVSICTVLGNLAARVYQKAIGADVNRPGLDMSHSQEASQRCTVRGPGSGSTSNNEPSSRLWLSERSSYLQSSTRRDCHCARGFWQHRVWLCTLEVHVITDYYCGTRRCPLRRHEQSDASMTHGRSHPCTSRIDQGRARPPGQRDLALHCRDPFQMLAAGRT